MPKVRDFAARVRGGGLARRLLPPPRLGLLSWSWPRRSRSRTARTAASDRSKITGPVTAETSHHGSVGHSQGPRVPHEMQVTVDLTLVSFPLVTSAPEKTLHCTNYGGGLVKDRGAGDSGCILTQVQASKTRRRDVASHRRLGHVKVPAYLPSCKRGGPDARVFPPVASAPEPVLHGSSGGGGLGEDGRTRRFAARCNALGREAIRASTGLGGHAERPASVGLRADGYTRAAVSQDGRARRRDGAPKDDAPKKPHLTASSRQGRLTSARTFSRPTPRRSPT